VDGRGIDDIRKPGAATISRVPVMWPGFEAYILTAGWQGTPVQRTAASPENALVGPNHEPSNARFLYMHVYVSFRVRSQTARRKLLAGTRSRHPLPFPCHSEQGRRPRGGSRFEEQCPAFRHGCMGPGARSEPIPVDAGAGDWSAMQTGLHASNFLRSACRLARNDMKKRSCSDATAGMTDVTGGRGD